MTTTTMSEWLCVCMCVCVFVCVCEGSTVSALVNATSAEVISPCARSPSLQLHAVDSPRPAAVVDRSDPPPPDTGDRSRLS